MNSFLLAPEAFRKSWTRVSVSCEMRAWYLASVLLISSQAFFDGSGNSFLFRYSFFKLPIKSSNELLSIILPLGASDFHIFRILYKYDGFFSKSKEIALRFGSLRRPFHFVPRASILSFGSQNFRDGETPRMTHGDNWHVQPSSNPKRRALDNTHRYRPLGDRKVCKADTVLGKIKDVMHETIQTRASDSM